MLGWDSCWRIRLNCLFIILRGRRRIQKLLCLAVPAQLPSVILDIECLQPLFSSEPLCFSQSTSPSLFLSLLPSFPLFQFPQLVPSLVPPWGCPACFLFPSLELPSLAPFPFLTFLLRLPLHRRSGKNSSERAPAPFCVPVTTPQVKITSAQP